MVATGALMVPNCHHMVPDAPYMISDSLYIVPDNRYMIPDPYMVFEMGLLFHLRLLILLKLDVD